ncbi:hypothetical protein BUALT_Bualt13G0098300 [Buddleja alternifolia]|uniref:6,7-dimethyl-8-ribityllumazine synthase n=1 Tax=Buddleja alternifolia TaxID=168488 RepID=A0AAV6WMW7_9LAMI|nr:hypothetical protein BUALT_Bualt13G0098300 [Buddleja alternifolia]
MGNSLRCCLACVLPCGALDLIRIVHLNGNVEELTGPITAGEVLKSNPGHVLTKPSSQGVVRRILILSPESELKRGSIYFLIPDSSMPASHEKGKKSIKTKYKSSKQQTVAEKKERREKKTTSSHRRKVSVGGWQPHLESITEDL